MKKLNLLILALATLAFISCEKEPAPTPRPTVTTGVFILNEGGMGSSNSKLALYDTDKKQVSYDVFEELNGKGLGDTGNDMLIYGSKMYIAVTGSKIIFVTDLEGKITKEIKHSNDAGELSPRKFAKLDGKVYVSYLEGYVGQFDTTSFSVKSVKVGPRPEGIVAVNNKIYVANSDGLYSETSGTPRVKTVSVIDATNLTVTKDLDVVENPSIMTLGDNGKIYFISWGVYNYATNKSSLSTLQKIDPATDLVTTISGVNPLKMSMGKDNKLYLLSTAYDAQWVATSTYDVLNTTNDFISKGFITDGTTIVLGCSISADPVTGNVYIGDAHDYKQDGDMYVFSAEGKKIDMFDTGEASPNGAFFITE